MRERLFRIGSTSYVYEDNLVANARRLSGVVDDIELVLFETVDYGHNLPGPAGVAELSDIAARNDLTYTVHLPADLGYGDTAGWGKIQRAVEATRGLNPFAYITHLDGRALMASPSAEAVAGWQAESARALDELVALIGDRQRICVENVERWDPAPFRDLVSAAGVSRCVDIGHWWVQGRDPLPHLREFLAQTRVIHLHGVDGDGRDHQSLRHTPPEALHAIIEALVRAKYRGVVSLEVFGEDDFFSSLRVLRSKLEAEA